MASSSASLGRGARGMLGKKVTFQTVVYPDKDIIRSSAAFSASWINCLRQGQSMRIIHPDGSECGVCVNIFDRNIRLLSGEVVSHRFGFVGPTQVVLKYKPAMGVFSMKLLDEPRAVGVPMEVQVPGDRRIPRVGRAEPVEDLIVPPNYDLDGISGWVKTVTPAMVRVHKPQVMHFPKKTSRLVLPLAQKTIMMLSEVSECRCKIVTSTRSEFERYITSEWGEFVRKSRIRAGDKLIFLLSNPPDTIIVEILRRNNRA